ncbi:hypothetical protein ACQQCD_04935 [Pseudarthrobacter sp. J1763]
MSKNIPAGSGAKKTGKSILEKRADKKAKAAASDILSVKPRKSPR